VGEFAQASPTRLRQIPERFARARRAPALNCISPRALHDRAYVAITRESRARV